jgi:gliding motility associated protien GldN
MMKTIGNTLMKTLHHWLYGNIVFLLPFLLCAETPPNPTPTIRTADIMYKKTVWRAVDLREKQNLPLFSVNNDLPSLLLQAAQQGSVTLYANDSLTRTLSWSDIEPLLVVPSTQQTDTVNAYMEYGADWRKQVPPVAYFSGRDFYQMEIKEEWIFDKNRSRMYQQIKSITLYLPADHPENIKGIQLPIASFDFERLKQTVLSPTNPKAYWMNPQNEAAHLSYASAFELRLFSSYIVKVGNGKNQYLYEVYGSEYKGLLASQWAAFELLEFEHHLWEQ